MPDKDFSYGVIEGFYGKPWSWEDREGCSSFLVENGYNFYIYAPKSDRFLREDWQKDWPEETYGRLMDFSKSLSNNNLRFGIGLSPFEIYTDFNIKAKEDLRRKILLINDLQPDILCILFDDMKGDQSRLAEMQVRVFSFAAEISTAKSFIICPSYYSFDPMFEKIFGKMPENYLEDLGRMTDPAVDIFWTGMHVCSPGYTESHLNEVAELLDRKPFIWDNYPVNDSPGMSPFLHLRAFRNRPYQMTEWTSGHAVNPMNQAHLSQIPLKTLGMSYELKEAYSPESAFVKSTRAICGSDLGSCIIEDISLFQDRGLNEMSKEEKDVLLKKYQAFQSPYASEIVSWLKGDFSEQ